jgi:hypothetical protein
MRLLVLTVAIFFGLAGQAMALGLDWKTESQLSKPEDVSACNPETDSGCGDHVAYVARSRYGVNMYFTYYEGVRVQIGFGTRPNEASMFLSEQLHPGAFDWGGSGEGKNFKPVFVIKRFYAYDSEKTAVDRNKTYLVTFRLNADGTSCAVWHPETTADTATARRWAERTLKGPGCPQ